jgi:hypothetical protein
MMVGVGTFPSATALSLPGRADDGFAGLAATAVGFVGFVALDAAVDFGFAVAGLALNGAGSSSAGGSATAILPNPSTDACGGIRQLQPIRVADSMPMRSILIRFPPRRGIVTGRFSNSE